MGACVSSFSISSITRFIFRITRSSGSGDVMSTPASLRRSIGALEPPRGQELAIAPQRFGVAGHHLLGERRRRGERGRVLKDVERAIEVADVRPLVGDVVIDDRDLGVVTVVAPRDVQIEFRERVAGQRLPFLRHLVHAQLELSELRLPENGGLDVLQIVAKDRQARLRILDLSQQVLVEQRLVEG